MTPVRFNEELKRFDKALNFEWNGRKSQWEIVGTDRKNKRYMIKAFKLGEIDTIGLHTIQELYECSPLKQGGAKELNRRIDRMIEEEDKKTKQAIADRINERLEDAWAHYQYREGLRVSFASVNKQGQTEEIVINDKRRIHDAPKGEE